MARVASRYRAREDPPSAARQARVVALCAVLLCVALPGTGSAEPEKNGFALRPSAVPPSEILGGGPPRDGIPALSNPDTVRASEAPWSNDEMVIGVVHAGAARAYPLAVLVWHEVVNDTVGDFPVLVSYCPLCGSAVCFDRRVGGSPRDFGVSGLLYRSDLLMFDRQTESLWSQIRAEAVTGPALGERLRLVRCRMERWGRWKREHPETRVLSKQTGHPRRYGESPYGAYDRSTRLLFPAPRDDRYHPKMPVVGIRVPGGPARAYPAVELRKAGGRAREVFAGNPVTVLYDLDDQVFEVEAPPAAEVLETYWFAWAAFHPDSSVFQATPRDEKKTKVDVNKKPRSGRGEKLADD